MTQELGIWGAVDGLMVNGVIETIYIIHSNPRLWHPRSLPNTHRTLLRKDTKFFRTNQSATICWNGTGSKGVETLPRNLLDSLEE
jgi:hypothetical protein